MTKKLKPVEKRSYWVGKCDRLFSRLVKDFGHWKCIETKSRNNLQTSHIISRSYFNIRWDFDNAVVLTQKRHKYYTHHPVEWKRFINNHFGDGYYEALENKAIVSRVWSKEAVKEKYEDLRRFSSAG